MNGRLALRLAFWGCFFLGLGVGLVLAALAMARPPQHAPGLRWPGHADER